MIFFLLLKHTNKYKGKYRKTNIEIMFKISMIFQKYDSFFIKNLVFYIMKNYGEFHTFLFDFHREISLKYTTFQI